MKIACLGWGSLVWNPQTLTVRKPWFSDGPLLPVEFARHSKGDRITLVIVPGHPHVRTLWALMSVFDLQVAMRSLAEREGISEENIPRSIGYCSMASDSGGEFANSIRNWASLNGLDAVIWTALRPKFNDRIDNVPSPEDVVSFLKNLPHERKKYAEQYVRMAPLQIDTDYRRKIEAELNWTPIGNY